MQNVKNHFSSQLQNVHQKRLGNVFLFLFPRMLFSIEKSTTASFIKKS